MAYRYTLTVTHAGLGKHRIISGSDKALVEAKGRAQGLTWEHQYRERLARTSEKNAANASRAAAKQEATASLEEAESRTSDAKAAIEQIQNTLRATLAVNDAIDWERMKNTARFGKSQPPAPEYLAYPKEPSPESPKYQPTFTLLDKLMKSRMEEKTELSRRLYEADYASWAQSVEANRIENDRRYALHLAELEYWNRERQEYEAEQERDNAAVDRRRAEYEALQPEAINDYCELVLSQSEYPDSFPQDFEVEYNPVTRIIVVDYSLPSPDDMPRVKEVKHVKSKDEFVESFLGEKELNRLFDDLVYQICLRTIHELFEADTVNAIDATVFNGWVESIDRANGKLVKGCVVSVQAKKDEFQKIDLAHVEPKACFKALRGVGSSKLHSLVPVAPVLAISREDKRFVASKEVANQLDEGFNLAAMDWEDFEHLIREIFEKEFSYAGGEVKITQASRDGGVDAVAFDPDPIRGGKTVIQAKRYTHTVGVSFVRDLYGTVLNEGASKGILVTTSDYGPDAYEFAKGKPLVLLTGGNLLHLLAKHGHKAKIDINEAKKILGEKT